MSVGRIGRVVALASALVVVSASAAARGAPPAIELPLGESLKGDAKAAFDAANLLVSNKDYAGASVKFHLAYSLSNDPRLLFNMAICEKDLRHYARMQSLLEEYLRVAGGRMSPQTREKVDLALGAIRDLVGRVKVVVSEAGAAVTIDGVSRGTTPLAEPLALDLGPHPLSVQKEGFLRLEQSIDVTGGSETVVSLTLVKPNQPARLSVLAGSSAAVTVDELPAVAGPFDRPLPPGKHTVHVTAPGKHAYDGTLDLRPGETRTLELTLETERRLIWPWALGGAVVVVAGAAVGGYFLFRPSTSGPGAPPAGEAPVGTVRFQSVHR